MAFPTSPANGQVYINPANVRFHYDGVGWGDEPFLNTLDSQQTITAQKTHTEPIVKSGTTSTLFRDDDTSSIVIAGGSTANTGGALQVYGPSEATFPNTVRLLGDTLQVRGRTVTDTYLETTSTGTKLQGPIWISNDQFSTRGTVTTPVVNSMLRLPVLEGGPGNINAEFLTFQYYSTIGGTFLPTVVWAETTAIGSAAVIFRLRTGVVDISASGTIDAFSTLSANDIDITSTSGGQHVVVAGEATSTDTITITPGDLLYGNLLRSPSDTANTTDAGVLGLLLYPT